MSNQRNQIPKFEELKQHTTYAFTYAPSDKQQFWGETERLQMFKSKISYWFMSTLKQSHIKVRIELSPHGRLHLHGYITIENKMDFYLYTIPKLQDYGNIVIKPITSPDEWEKYCCKQDIDDWLYLPIVHKPIKKPKRSQKSGTDSKETETSP